MATIDDIGGGPPNTLASPAFGGPTGWAAAVRDAIKAVTGQVKGPTAGGVISMGSMGAVAAGSQYTMAATFPAGRFTAAPIVQVAVSQAAGAVAPGYKASADTVSKINLTVSGVTATGFSVTAHFPVAATVTASQEIHWSATPRA